MRDPGARSGARTPGREDPVSDGGAPPQHAEYFPTGELWQDESDSRYEHYRRYLFNGKEMLSHPLIFGAPQEAQT